MAAHSTASSAAVPNNELQTIDQLTEEFFASFTTNTRKKEIEDALERWIRSLPNCWEKVFYLFQLSNSIYTKMICLSLLHDFLLQNWYLVPQTSRTHFYEGIFKYLLREHESLNPSLRNKLAQIVVFVVGQDWTENSPSFLVNIFQLFNLKTYSTSQGSILFAVSLIKLTVEELPVKFEKHQLFLTKDEFVNKIQQVVPDFLEKLSSAIESIMKMQIDMMSSTPPPSPTNFCSQNSVDARKLDNLERLLGSISEMDHDVIEVLISITQCVESIIDFMAASHLNHFSKVLLSALGFFATVALLKPTESLVSLAHSAMNCVNLLLSKKFNFDSKLVIIYDEICHYFFVFLKTNIKMIFERSQEDMDAELVKKFVDFLRYFMTIQFKKPRDNPLFSLESFGALLIQVTEKMYRFDFKCYIECLTLWHLYFEAFDCAQKSTLLDQTVFLYTEFSISSLQYSLNRHILEQLDNEELDKNELTEFDRFVNDSTNIICRICELYPVEGTIYVFDNFFSKKINEFRAAISQLEASSASGTLNLNKNLNGKFFTSEPLCQLQVAIHDFVIALRVSSSLLQEHRQDSVQVTRRLEMAFHLCCDILKFLDDRRYTRYQDSNNPVFGGFLELKVQLLSTLMAYDRIQMQNNVSSVSSSLLLDNCSQILCDIELVNSLPNELKPAQRKLFHGASIILRDLSFIDRRPVAQSQLFIERFCSQQFFDKFLSSFMKTDSVSIPLRDQILILQAIINFLILSFDKSASDQMWDKRQQVLSTFIARFFDLFNNLTQQIVNTTSAATKFQQESNNLIEVRIAQKCPNVFCQSLYVMKKVIQQYHLSVTKSKQIFFDSLKESLEAFVRLLVNHEYLYSTLNGILIVRHVFGLFYAVFDVLIKQLPDTFFMSIVNNFMQIIHAFQILSLSVDLSKETPQKIIAGLQVVQRFVKLLTVSLKHTKFKNRDLLRNILEFLTQQVYVSLVKDKSPVVNFLTQQSGHLYDIYSKFLDIYYESLQEAIVWNSSYFFPLNGAKVKDDNHVLFFQRIMEIFGQSFSHPENLQMFAKNIKTLDHLNTSVSIKIFSRPQFQNQFLEPFLLLFLQLSQQQSLKLLEENMFSLIYQLASVDFARFQSNILPKFISSFSIAAPDCKVLESNFSKGRNNSVASSPGRILSTTSDSNGIDSFAFSKSLFQLFTDIRFYLHQNSANKFAIIT